MEEVLPVVGQVIVQVCGGSVQSTNSTSKTKGEVQVVIDTETKPSDEQIGEITRCVNRLLDSTTGPIDIFKTNFKAKTKTFSVNFRLGAEEKESLKKSDVKVEVKKKVSGKKKHSEERNLDGFSGWNAGQPSLLQQFSEEIVSLALKQVGSEAVDSLKRDELNEQTLRVLERLSARCYAEGLAAGLPVGAKLSSKCSLE